MEANDPLGIAHMTFRGHRVYYEAYTGKYSVYAGKFGNAVYRRLEPIEMQAILFHLTKQVTEPTI